MYFIASGVKRIIHYTKDLVIRGLLYGGSTQYV